MGEEEAKEIEEDESKREGGGWLEAQVHRPAQPALVSRPYSLSADAWRRLWEWD
jgi:hypothetical protein